VYIVRNNDINFDRSTFTGNQILIRRILEKTVPAGEKLVILNSFTFLNYNDHLSRVNFMV